MVCSVESNPNNIYMVDCMDIQTSKHSLESLLAKLSHNGQRPTNMTIRQLIIICKNVDMNSIYTHREFLPLMRRQVQKPNTQTYFIITTNSKYEGSCLLHDEIAVLSFHQVRQNSLTGSNDITRYEKRQILPESGSFLGFFLRRKVVGLETRNINR